jgi:hypothetical protein
MATLKNEEGDLGYAVVADYCEHIRFIPFDSVQNYCKDIILDTYDPCLAPSISITPADLLHVVWQRDESENGKIYYTTTTEKVFPDDIRDDKAPEWSDTVQISISQPDTP